MSVEEVEISEDGFVWVGTGVYGPNLDGELGFFWDELVEAWHKFS